MSSNDQAWSQRKREPFISRSEKGISDNEGDSFRKIRERFEQSNDLISKEIDRVNPDDPPRSSLTNFSNILFSNLNGGLDLVSDPLSDDEHSRRSMNYKRSMVSIEMPQVDAQSLAASRKVKRKKGKTIRFDPSKHSMIDKPCTVVCRTISQHSNKTSKKAKRIPRKVVYKTAASKDKINTLTRVSSRSSQKAQNFNDYQYENKECVRSKSYTKITCDDNNVSTDGKLYENSKLLDHINAGDTLLSLSKTIHNNGSNEVNSDQIEMNHRTNADLTDNEVVEIYDPTQVQPMYNYELPTIASKMRSANRTQVRKETETNRRPFVVGTSIAVTNNLYLLKQQLAFKINTYCMSSVSEENMRGWKLYNLRSLIQRVEGSASSKLKQ